jgi:predicted GTPase
MMPAWLRRHWREVLLVVLVALPWASLLALGLVWLWQEGRMLPWAVAAAFLGLAAWPLRRSIRVRTKRRAREELAEQAKPSWGWGATGQAAWQDLQTLAEETKPLTFTEKEAPLALIQKAVETVARRFHPGSTDAVARVTLPEALLLTERIARDLRRAALHHVPGVRQVRIDHLLWVKRQNDRYGKAALLAAKVGHGAFRVVRLFLNPTRAIAQEAQGALQGEAGGLLSYRARTYATRMLILEAGRAAIDLYSGNLRMSDDEIAAAREADQAGIARKQESLVRILLAGQVKAGKSSTVNAMAGAVLCEVSPISTPAKTVEYRLQADGRPAATIVDTPGITSVGGTHNEILQQAQRCDLVIWVASAVQPARAADVEALRALRRQFAEAVDRRPPPVLVALTHVDQVRPAAEWSPPYDTLEPRSAKERNIKAALDAASKALEVPLERIVPVAAPDGTEPYNHDLLWGHVLARLDEARLRQLERLRASRSGFSLWELAGQVGRSTALLAKAAIRS